MSRAGAIALAASIVLGGLIAVFVVFLRTDTQSFRMAAGSMEPTLEIGERFDVNQDAYDDGAPQRRDIVVFHPPQAAIDGREPCGVRVRGRRLCPRPVEGVADEVTLAKRVVALPGERVRVADGGVVIDGEPLREPYANLSACGTPGCTFRGSIVVPGEHVFLMGDNRGASDDSRFWGPVPHDQIVGRVDDCLPFGLRCEEDDRAG